MSLINDALKRATQAQPATTPAPELETDMKPVQVSRSVGLPVYFTPVLLFIVSGACWFLIKGSNSNQQLNLVAREPIVAQAREIPDMPPAEGAELPIPDNRQFALNDSPSAAVETATADSSVNSDPDDSSSNTVVAEAPEAVTFKLQGIFFRPSKPSAVVNSKTVYIGDIIASAKVKAIDHRSVTLDFAGGTKVLTLD